MDRSRKIDGQVKRVGEGWGEEDKKSTFERGKGRTKEGQGLVCRRRPREGPG